MTRGRGYFRPMPEDFMLHAGETYQQLIRRYRASTETVKRWKELCGAARPKARLRCMC